MTQQEILVALSKNEITAEQAMGWLKAITDANKAPAGELYCKVGAKGGVSVGGLNKQFPMTLYVEQWEKLSKFIRDGKLDEFIKANDESLERKGDSEEKKLERAKTPARVAAIEKSASYGKK